MGIFQEHNINIYSDCSDDVKFVYKKNFDSPENHFMHLNRYYEVFVFIDGDADYIVENRLYPMKRGDVVVITPYEVHKAMLRRECDYERFYLLIPTDAFEFMNFDPLKRISEMIASGGNLISLKAPQREELTEILYDIKNELESELSDRLRIYSQFLRFIDLIFDIGDSENASLDLRRGFPPLLCEVLAYIDGEFTERINVSEIAARFHVSLPYLSSLFKAHTGVGIKRYIMLKRIGYAKGLLESGNTVTQACYDSGFCSCSYFIKRFKETVGVTPHSYASRGMKH